MIDLFILGALTILLELTMIRWIGAEIRIFAYLQNFILVTCFLGLGLGCMSPERNTGFAPVLFPLGVLLTLFCIPDGYLLLKQTTYLLTVLQDFFVFQGSGISGDLSLSSAGLILSLSLGVGIFASLIATCITMMLPLGRLMGRLLSSQRNLLPLYSSNLLGTLAGSWMFVLTGFAMLSPPWWIAIILLLTAGLFRREVFVDERRSALVFFLWIGVVSLLAFRSPPATEAIWSPYQKLELTRRDDSRSPYVIGVNGTGYQSMDRADAETWQIYSVAPSLYPTAKKVLLIGSGSGNDVAEFVARGFTDITAVELDPAILGWGRALHPNKPYDSPAVHAVLDDGRRFLQTAEPGYDLVVFCFLDSHTNAAGTNSRLDHLIYTRESFEAVRRILSPDGVAVVAFYTQGDFIPPRISGMLTEVFGAPTTVLPVTTNGRSTSGIFFANGSKERIAHALETTSELGAMIESSETYTYRSWMGKTLPEALAQTIEGTTDDWPYLYLRERKIPVLYFLLSAAVAAMTVLTARLNGIGFSVSDIGAHAPFFFLGVAFMLLEMHGIVRAQEILGSTSMVSAYIISGIMVMLLAANGAYAALRRRCGDWLYAALIGAVLLEYLFPYSAVYTLEFAPRLVLVSLVLCVPVFFSGLVFMRAFERSGNPERAMAFNLLGSLVGGILQSLSFVTGIRSLLIGVALCYLIAYLTSKRASAPLTR